MNDLLAIDPGTSTGWARFEATTLVACGLVKPERYESLPFARHVIVEEPTIYPHSEARPADIMALQLKVGMLVQALRSRGANVTLVQPRTWKRQVPKDIHNRRTLAKLTDAERLLLPPKVRHDTIDAIGLGLWRLGR